MKKLLLLLFIVLAVIGLWYWESPYLALKNLQDAAQDRDVAELERSIDLPALQVSLKSELGAQLERRVGGGPLGRVGSGAGRAVIDGAVDQYVTAQQLGNAMAQPPRDPLLQAIAGSLGALATREAARTEWTLERGFNTFRVRREAGDGAALPALVFERHGIGWKLAGVDFPEPGTTRPGSSEAP